MIVLKIYQERIWGYFVKILNELQLLAEKWVYNVKSCFVCSTFQQKYCTIACEFSQFSICWESLAYILKNYINFNTF